MGLLLSLLITLVFIVYAAVKWKVNPVFTLFLAALFMGISQGLPPVFVIEKLLEGLGKTIAAIGFVIAFGTVIGVFLEKSGGTDVITKKVLEKVPLKKSPLAMNLIGFIISIPVFCDSGFVILSSLNKSLSKKTNIPLVVFAVALATGLYATHVFVPPTPGPLAAAAVMKADIGLLMLAGLMLAIPVSLTGYLWAMLIKKKVVVDEALEEPSALNSGVEKSFVANNLLWKVLLPLMLPIMLIAIKSVINFPSKPLGEGTLFQFFDFLGNPVMALLLGVLISVVSITSEEINIEKKQEWINHAFKEAGLIILVTGAGGAFGAVLRELNLSELIDPENGFIKNGLLLSFVLAALLKTAQGSSTVSIITTAAIIGPLLPVLGLETEFEKVLAVLAVGAGAMTVSHVNDSYFWVVTQFSSMNIKTGLKSYSAATLLQGLVAITIVVLVGAMVN